MSKFRVLVPSLGLSALVGCTGHLNQTNGLEGMPPNTLPALVAESPSLIAANEEPSTRGLDRSHWELTLVQVPRGQVEVQPTYCAGLGIAQGSARSTGAYPTATTALEGGSTTYSIMHDGVAEPFWPVVLFLIAPVKMVRGEWPCDTVREPGGGYEVVDRAGD